MPGDGARSTKTEQVWQAFALFEAWTRVELPRVAAFGDGWPQPIVQLVFYAHVLAPVERALFDELRWYCPQVGPVTDYDLANLLARLGALLPSERSVFEFAYGTTRTWLRDHGMRSAAHRRDSDRCPFCLGMLPQGPLP